MSPVSFTWLARRRAADVDERRRCACGDETSKRTLNTYMHFLPGESFKLMESLKLFEASL